MENEKWERSYDALIKRLKGVAEWYHTKANGLSWQRNLNEYEMLCVLKEQAIADKIDKIVEYELKQCG